MAMRGTQTLRFVLAGLAAWALAGVGGVGGCVVGGCASKPREVLVPPKKLVAPYDASRGQALWAVAPVRDESGTTVFDPGVVSDKLVAAAEEIEGVRCLPLNRTLEAMRSLGMPAVRTPGDARKLASAMGVDGLIVASVTAWDPYTPKIGLSAALYAAPGWTRAGKAPLDPRVLASSPTVDTAGGPRYADTPTAVASEHLDGQNHQVQMDLEGYAAGRQRSVSANGWKRYLASMDLYSEFAAFKVMEGLLREEWVRTAVAGVGRPE
jgi:hypothetical protein